MKMDFAAGVYLSEAQNPTHTPRTQYIRVYTMVLIHTGQGRGGGVNQREGEKGNSS